MNKLTENMSEELLRPISCTTSCDSKFDLGLTSCLDIKYENKSFPILLTPLKEETFIENEQNTNNVFSSGMLNHKIKEETKEDQAPLSSLLSDVKFEVGDCKFVTAQLIRRQGNQMKVENNTNLPHCESSNNLMEEYDVKSSSDKINIYNVIKKSEEDLHKTLEKDIHDNSKRCMQNQSEDNAKKCAQNQSEEESCLDGCDEDEGNCYYCGTASSSKWHSECRKLFFGGIVAAFSCNICKMKFKGKRSLTYHKMTHTGDGVICGFCGKLLFGKKSVNYHKQKHTSHRSHKCSICFKVYHSNYYLLEHMNIHTGQTQKYLCHTCGLLCSKTRYYTHIRMHSNVKNYICDKCGKSFTKYNELNSHLISHSSDINYNCAVCNKGTKTRTLLMNHIKTKHPQTMGLPETLGRPQKFPCSICNKKLSSKNTLTMHMQMHRGEKNFRCTICSKRLSSKTGLNMHIQMHKGEKNYQCTICSKKFLNKVYLMKHSISHTRERNYKCDLCDKTYMYPNDLAKHKSSVHSKKKTKKQTKINITH